MALDLTLLETIIPSRFLSFTIPNPNNPKHLLRVAVLDSPIQPPDSPRVGALIVPQNRESDWIFSTESGHLHLLLSSSGISRLILIGPDPIDDPDLPITHVKNRDTQYVKGLEFVSKQLSFALCPKICYKDGFFDVPILEYEDNVICSLVLERVVGDFVNEMLVEDVEVESESDNREFRRRLRLKRMPNLVQTEIRLIPEKDCIDSIKLGEAEFKPDLTVLVHSYLVPMVASLWLTGSCIEKRIRSGFRPKALCLGVGGGALPSFLRTQLEFEVFGVEVDEVVLRVARKYFGLDDTEIKIYVDDAIEFLRRLGSQCCSSFNSHHDGFDTEFDVIMIDLDCSDVTSGVGCPPLELVNGDVLSAAKSVLCDFGLVVVNVIPPSRSYYESLISEFRRVFLELFEIDVENGNFVLIAAVSPVSMEVSSCKNEFYEKLKEVILGKYLDSIRKI